MTRAKVLLKKAQDQVEARDQAHLLLEDFEKTQSNDMFKEVIKLGTVVSEK